ncbi:MAG: DUF3566 domain-containing protein [Micrococcales bacterium]|nr:DUF3566 domain-containing protein [Micrococcales bacterium]
MRVAAADRRSRAGSGAGHAMDPPPIIRPAAKPQRATGEVRAVGALPASDAGTPGQPPAPGLGGQIDASAPQPRRFRTPKTATGPDQAAAAKSTAAGAAAPGEVPASPAPPPIPLLSGSSLVPGDEAGTTGKAAKKGKKGPKAIRKIKLSLSYVSPLSVAKMSFLISLAAGIAWVVMIWVLWTALDQKHVFAEIDSMIQDLAGEPKARELNLMQYVGRGRIMSGAMMVGAINVVIGTILATLGAVIYNVLSALVGGIHMTLREEQRG